VGYEISTIEDAIGKNPLVALQRIAAARKPDTWQPGAGQAGQQPSVKDRPALAMIGAPRKRGEIQPGDTRSRPPRATLQHCMHGRTAIKGYMILIMPEG
jgi:cysteine synthase B